MSDEEYEYEYGSDAEDFNYSDAGDEDGGGENDELIEIENAFYEGDDCRNDDPQRALEMFQKVVTLETERGTEVKWRFKALEHLVTLQYRIGQYEAMVKSYAEMLKHISTVTRNECGDAINSILETIANIGDGHFATLSQMYELTFGALKEANNERLWFNTNVKVGKVYLQNRDYTRVAKIVRELHEACQLPDGSGDDPSKGTSLLEVYSLEIQLCTATKNTMHMKRIYPKTLNLNAAVADPRIMGVIREEGGKMYMADEHWSDAYNEFYEGFRAYQEAGNLRAKDCLKYVVLANMLALSDINPFAAREAKVYQEDKEIMAMMELRMAYEANDLSKFERTLKNKQNKILDDPFIMTYVEPLRRRMREQVLLALVKPYQTIRLGFIARELTLPQPDVESLLVDMILDKRVVGKVDQINGFLQLGDGKSSLVSKKYDALAKWSEALGSLSATLGARVP